jgi:hypothetical protein
MKAFCLKAPTVRFVNLAIVFAGVLSREWFFNSRKSSLKRAISRFRFVQNYGKVTAPGKSS